MRVVCPSRELSLLPPAASWSFETQVLIDSMTGKVNFLTKLLGDISVRRVFSLSFHHVIFFPPVDRGPLYPWERSPLSAPTLSCLPGYQSLG